MRETAAARVPRWSLMDDGTRRRWRGILRKRRERRDRWRAEKEGSGVVDRVETGGFDRSPGIGYAIWKLWTGISYV